MARPRSSVTSHREKNLKMDFDGNFNRSGQRQLSSSRSTTPVHPPGYGGIDWRVTETEHAIRSDGDTDWTRSLLHRTKNMLRNHGALGIDSAIPMSALRQFPIGYPHELRQVPDHGPENRRSLCPPSAFTPSPPRNISQTVGLRRNAGRTGKHAQGEGRIVGQLKLDTLLPALAPAQRIFSFKRATAQPSAGARGNRALTNIVPWPNYWTNTKSFAYRKQFQQLAARVGRGQPTSWGF